MVTLRRLTLVVLLFLMVTMLRQLWDLCCLNEPIDFMVRENLYYSTGMVLKEHEDLVLRDSSEQSYLSKHAEYFKRFHTLKDTPYTNIKNYRNSLNNFIIRKDSSSKKHVNPLSDGKNKFPSYAIKGTYSSSDVKQGNSIYGTRSRSINTKSESSNIGTKKYWCPSPGQGLKSIMVLALAGGGLCNQVWEYLSAWAVAKRYELHHIVEAETIDKLNSTFDLLTLPVLDEVVERCNLTELGKLYWSARTMCYQNDLINRIADPEPGLTLIKLQMFTIHTEVLVPYWRELRNQIRVREEFRTAAEETLRNVKSKMRRNILKRQDNGTRHIRVTLRNLEYVGVHVRRTDYSHHLNRSYPGAIPANTGFFKSAMTWLREHVKAPLVFVVTSDDPEWCVKELAREDDVLVVGDPNSPGHDLALLAACNHTVFAYGSFGLTAAMLAQGRNTLVYDTQNGTHTKEMEFVRFLPGWRLMDNDGRVNYWPYYELTYALG